MLVVGDFVMKRQLSAGVEPTPNLQSSQDICATDSSQNSTLTTEEQDERPLKRRASTASEEIHALAQQFTRQSERLDYKTPFEPEHDSQLDPSSEEFNARKWARAFYSVMSENVPPRVAGVAFDSLNVFGYDSDVDYQKTVGNRVLSLISRVPGLFGARQRRTNILYDIEGVVQPGEMLCVLGPPGSGCSTLLKTIAGDTHGLNISPESKVNYEGISPKIMHSRFRGEAIYTAEVDAHYPALTVSDTLYFAAMARTPYSLPTEVHRTTYAAHFRDVIMSLFGISHTHNTRVGNDLVRGVSGGERKRVTIAEAALSNAPLQCWDNSTRGLDSANAVEFCRTLRIQSDVFGFTSCVAIYQAPQAAFDVFDKVTVLYEGHQIYFGATHAAKEYFQNLGFDCPPSQTVPDFLTSMTSPGERVIKPGHENTVPRTAEDFAQRWKTSDDRQRLIRDINSYNAEHPTKGPSYQKFAESRIAEKSSMQRVSSPYTLSYGRQIKLCMWRELQRLKTDPSVTLVMLFANFFEALIISSIFYNLPQTTSSFFARGAVLFMTILLNAFGSILEIIGLYAKRTIVEKHSRYALYHPSAEAVSSIIMDMPYKILNALLVNSTLYFMSNLRREPGPYFFFYLVSFTLTLGMSMFFRLFASLTKTIDQALAPSAIVLTAMVLYTGFAIPVRYMLGWASWIRWINPVYYGFESVMLNEFWGQQYSCSQFVPSGPGYENTLPDQRACSAVGSVLGSSLVSGAEHVRSTYSYVNSHRWRNFGIIVGMTFGLAILHLIVTEVITSERSKGEILVFPRSKLKAGKGPKKSLDEENIQPAARNDRHDDSTGSDVQTVEKQTAVFHWEDVSYEIKVKGEPRTILDHVDGWVKPGTLTALMGVSGAGKTTLLDVLASRTTMGVITGQMLVDGCERDDSFPRKTGYVKQQDLHLQTSTVREALEFSALLRQPAKYTRQERLDYVDTVINLLDMESYAYAVVGSPGEGLNVEQRKRLTIGVELAARPSLLLFLDEPTSGLDSQTSWSICNLMEKLTRNGQAILCTIHQPSAILFQRFDRLLLLAKGGKTVYFGEIGKGSRTLIDYFVSKGGPDCPDGVNPAEYMLETIGAAPGASTKIDWPVMWRQSEEYQNVKRELAGLHRLSTGQSAANSTSESPSSSDYKEFAAPFIQQLQLVNQRTFQQYWRTPSYIYSKALLTIGTSLFIGFSFFNSSNSQQGLQNQMFGAFVFLFVVIQLMLQIIPTFVVQRALYESRERQSRTYHWAAFLLSNVLVELTWNSLVAVFCFLTWYYPMGLWRNAEWTDSVHQRSLLALLYIWASLLFSSSLAHAIIAGITDPQVASAIANLLGVMMYAFCGVLAGPDALPRFWIFMYRANPFTYLVDGFLSSTLANAPVFCASNELLTFYAPSNQTCGEYTRSYIEMSGGEIVNPNANGTERCQFCPLSDTNQFLNNIGAEYGLRWRNFGLLWVYIGVNLIATISFYWLFRVPNKKKSQAAVMKR